MMPPKILSVTTMILVGVSLISWNYSNKSKNSSNDPVYMDLPGFIGDIDNIPPGFDQRPPAEDVLVRKIPGDSYHLLMLAYYSKENFAAPSFAIENGYKIVFKDDGSGYDAKAADGLYTAVINADVQQFRKQAINLMQQMKTSGYRPVRYINRMLVYNPDASEGFDLKNFDAGETVSITAITNGLSDFLPDAQGDANTRTTSTSTASSATVSAGTTSAATAATTPTTSVIGKNSIFITNVAVVEDTTRTWNYCTQKGNVNGPWTFGTLMRQLASKSPSQIATDVQVSNFVKSWLNHWTSTQIINGDTIKARTLMNTQILTPWLNKSKSAGAPSGQLDMRFAPFKLTAIVNRFDLRGGQKFASPVEFCGEGRFVFCLIKSDCTTPLSMTANFEYAINRPGTCADEQAWAQQWFNLASLTIGSSDYNQALQNITDQFALCGTNINRNNQSSLNRLRTNEITLASLPKQWELREFFLDSTGNLAETTVGQTPADKYNVKLNNADVQRFAAYVNQNSSTIIAGTNVVPAIWQSFPFLGGATHITSFPTGNPPNVFHWDGTDSSNKPTFVKSNSARFTISFQTCSGCHSGETQTGFTHVTPVMFGTETTLSGFLSGKAGVNAVDFDHDSTNRLMSVEDAALRPSSSPTIRTFNDIDRRAKDLKAFTSTVCGTPLNVSSQLLFQPVNTVH